MTSSPGRARTGKGKGKGKQARFESTPGGGLGRLFFFVWLGRKVLLPRRGTVGRESLLDFLLLRTEDLFGSLGPGGAPSLPAFFRLKPTWRFE